MLYTAEEVLEYVEQEDVQCIRLAFFDVLGCPKSISIMPSQLRQAFHAGVPFDASAVGFYGSLFLFPQPETLKLLPWHTEEGKTVCLYCSVRRSNGAPFPLDGRYILNQAEREARDMGFSLCFYTEYEFYLFTSDANGNPTKMPHDQAGYMDMAPKDKGENVRRDICLTLEKMGITPVFSCHRPGPGQHQVLCFPASPIEAADNAMTFQAVVHTIAHRNGLHASFAPKPLLRQNSSGLCIRISMGKTGRQQMCSFFAGIREHLREITAFLCPARQSYERLADIRDRQLLFLDGRGRNSLHKAGFSGSCG